ncbi:hypothetical protein QVD17_22810 [Tagetes erecta]|uniref:BHLH domain-containing protein n=1 Tax=Tagetes erecta TaxID=13708 RepID=A0AAD8KFX0_TARER|nr:hypothetical protein QVD17_22810 [Tagetes erecta]
MENIDEMNQKNYWDSIHQIEDYSWNELQGSFTSYYDSSSPDPDGNQSSPELDGTQSASASKNIVSERNRRKKLNDRLFALRAVVPNISKMDKASIIKDAIDYIQLLHDQERSIQAELIELESRKLEPMNLDPCPTRMNRSDPRVYPIEILELNLSYVEDKTVLVSLKCSKKRDTIVRLCEVFESLKLNIVTANISSSSSEKLFNTLFIQLGEEEDMDNLKTKIETAIKLFNHPDQTAFTM